MSSCGADWDSGWDGRVDWRGGSQLCGGGKRRVPNGACQTARAKRRGRKHGASQTAQNRERRDNARRNDERRNDERRNDEPRLRAAI
jgi:hypothetical protein